MNALEEAVRIAEQVPGWMSHAELEWLGRHAHENRVIFEIGSWQGRSTKVLAMMTKGVVYSVDNLAGEEDTPVDDLQERFDLHLAKELRLDRVRVIRKPSLEVVGDFFPGFADMVFIDGSHEYPDPLEDIRAWRGILRQGGLLCGHDRWLPGVERSLRELGDELDLWAGADFDLGGAGVTYISEPWLIPYIDEGDLALDIGANWGYFGRYLRDSYEEVWAFEPHPAAARVIRDNFGDQLKVYEAAVGESSGTLTMQTFPFGNQQHTTAVVYDEVTPEMNLDARGTLESEIEVEQIALDLMPELTDRRVDLVKVDVEGWEMHVLRGARKILKRDRPRLLVEVHFACQGEPEHYLQKLGYQTNIVHHPSRDSAPEFYWTYWVVAS